MMFTKSSIKKLTPIKLKIKAETVIPSVMKYFKKNTNTPSINTPVFTIGQEIAEIARNAGASVPFMRSEKTANDFATTDDVLLEVLEEYEKRGKVFDYMACIYPTAPFVTAKKLQDALQILRDNNASRVMPVVQFSFPPQRGMAIRNGRLEYCQPENALVRSQDLEPMYHDCGQFYVYDVEKYRACKGDLPDGYFPIEVSDLEVQDIDNMSDWKLAEIKYGMMTKCN